MLLLRTVFNFVFMRKWASSLQVKASEFLAVGKSKSSFPVSRAEGPEEVWGSLCLGDCLSGSEAREGKIREGSRKGCRGLGEAEMALSYQEEVQRGSREWAPSWGWLEGRIVFYEQRQCFKETLKMPERMCLPASLPLGMWAILAHSQPQKEEKNPWALRLYKVGVWHNSYGVHCSFSR